MERSKNLTPPADFAAILDLIATLRGENGCPWDRGQTPQSLTVFLIEETYELVEAVLADDPDAIGEELGDVFFQLFFLVSIFQQEGRLALDDVVAHNLQKMIRRHPHVFGNEKIDTAGQVKRRWKEIKQQEKEDLCDQPESIMDSVPDGLPALLRAYRISERAAGIGFDWGHIREVIDQVEAEWSEFKAELHLDRSEPEIDPQKAAMEFGDVLFSMVNVARVSGLHPETALSRSTQKFIRRFRKMEAAAAERRRRLDELSREELEDLWRAAKDGGG